MNSGFLFGSCFSQWLWQDAQLPPQPSPFQPPCLEIHTTASANRTIRTISVMIPRSVSIFCTSFPGGKVSVFSIHDLASKGNRKADTKSVIFYKKSFFYCKKRDKTISLPIRTQKKKEEESPGGRTRTPTPHTGEGATSPPSTLTPNRIPISYEKGFGYVFCLSEVLRKDYSER